MLTKIRRMMMLVLFLLIAATALSAYLYYHQSKSQLGCATIDTNPNSVHTNFPDGKAKFNANCASCHAMDKTLTGPALLGVSDRWPDKKLLVEHVKNAKLVRKKSSYAQKLWLAYGKVECQDFSEVLTDSDIKAILEYIQARGIQY